MNVNERYTAMGQRALVLESQWGTNSQKKSTHVVNDVKTAVHFLKNHPKPTHSPV